MEQYNYRVKFEPFTERHYISKFKKKYGDQWLATERTIIAVCERIDNMLQYNRADFISISARGHIDISGEKFNDDKYHVFLVETYTEAGLSTYGLSSVRSKDAKNAFYEAAGKVFNVHVNHE